MSLLPFRHRKSHIDALKEGCQQFAKVEPGDTRPFTEHLNGVILEYYEDVRRQAQQSFASATLMGTLGALVFLYGCYEAMHSDGRASAGTLTPATLTVIGGAMVQILSGVQFFLYSRATRQFSSFHICLERMNRFLLADTIALGLKDSAVQQTARLHLLRSIANAPMLTLDDAGAAVASNEAIPKPPAAA
jgi:TRADD-N domain-containing protein